MLAAKTAVSQTADRGPVRQWYSVGVLLGEIRSTGQPYRRFADGAQPGRSDGAGRGCYGTGHNLEGTSKWLNQKPTPHIVTRATILWIRWNSYFLPPVWNIWHFATIRSNRHSVLVMDA